ncbi:MAG: hormogonium polysaccharide biosynthesis glycosyltransferase HpsE [Phormidesmis sp.]
MVNFTVAVPTYNGARHLHKLLDALAVQTNLKHISWEVIIADNNSNDDTAAVVRYYQTKWPQASQLRYLLEKKQGAGFARHHAAKAASGEFIGFLDDDVIPDADWIARAYEFGKSNAKAGIFSGQIHGVFGAPPPKNFRRIQGFLAVREHGSKAFQFDPDTLSMPTGAAFVIRREAWVSNVPNEPIFVGRVGTSMVGGEDLEPMLMIHNAGWETWYTPSMHAYHQIPGQRFEKQYLRHLIYTCALCTCQLRMLAQSGPVQKAAVIPRIWIGNLKRVTAHLIKHRREAFTEVVPACELAFLLGNLASPFYWLKKTTSNLTTKAKEIIK